MKCPSCNADCEADADLCPVCGHSFEPNAPKKTMMGFPSLGAALLEAEQTPHEEPQKQTLFGFPAQKGLKQASEVEDEATSIIPASAIAFGSDLVPVSKPVEDAETADQDLRGTVAGLPLKPADEGDATQIVSGAAIFPAESGAKEEPPPSGIGELRDQGTLMGMSLADLHAADAAADQSGDEFPEGRATQFAIPAVQGDKPKPPGAGAKPKGLEEASEDSVELPTQAWSPGAVSSFEQHKEVSSRKKLLDKIRKSRPTAKEAEADKPLPEMTGPNLSALKNLKPRKPSVGDERDTAENEAANPGATVKPSIAQESSAAEDELGESISDPDFGLLETDIASGDVLKQAVQSFASRDDSSPQAQSSDASMEPSSDPAPNVFQGGVPAPAPTPTPAAEPAPAPAPLATQPPTAQPQPQPAAAPAPSPAAQAFAAPPAASSAPTAPSPAVAAAAPAPAGQPAPAPGPMPQAAPQHQSPAPFQPPPPTQMAPGQQQPYVPTDGPVAPAGDDALVATIQSIFGFAAGLITILLQFYILGAEGIPELGGILVIGMAMALGGAAVAGAFLPRTNDARSKWLGICAVALLFVTAAGAAAGLPAQFYATGLGALLAVVGAAFPKIARSIA